MRLRARPVVKLPLPSLNLFLSLSLNARLFGPLAFLACSGGVACSGGIADDSEDEDGAAEDSSDGAAGSGSEGSGGSESAWEPTCPDSAQGFATEVLGTDFGPGQDFGRTDLPDIALGAPKGGGKTAGSLDVVSLGDGGSLTLGFSPRVIEDGPGADFIVFENPFFIGGDERYPLSEFGIVSVSEDGETWATFPCDPDDLEETSCAGVNPVLAHAEQQDVDPFSPAEAGGDAFDLADVGLTSAAYVRITDLAGDEMVFDLDALAVVNGRCL